MKGKAIAKIAICSVLAVVLAGILVLGLWGGDIILPNININVFNGSDDVGYTIGDGTVMGRINELDIDWISGSVTIKYHDGEETILRETKVEKEDHRMRYKLEGGVLSILPCKTGRVTVQLKNNEIKKDLEILLPRDMAQVLEISLVSAKLSMEGIRMEEVEVDTVSGDIRLTDCTLDRLHVDGVSGNLYAENTNLRILDMDGTSSNCNLKGQVEEVSIDTVSGNLNLDLENHPVMVEMSAVSGNCDLTIPADTQFRLECDGIKDKVNIVNFAVQKEDGVYQTSGWNHSGCDMGFDVVTGTVTITGAE